jgi:hypothetical protein
MNITACWRSSWLARAWAYGLSGLFLFRRLRRGQLRYRLTGPGVGDAKPAAEVFEHVAKSVQERDHERTCIRDALKSPPLADKAKGPVPRLDQVSAEKALERGRDFRCASTNCCSFPGFTLKRTTLNAVMSRLRWLSQLLLEPASALAASPSALFYAALTYQPGAPLRSRYVGYHTPGDPHGRASEGTTRTRWPPQMKRCCRCQAEIDDRGRSRPTTI